MNTYFLFKKESGGCQAYLCQAKALLDLLLSHFFSDCFVLYWFIYSAECSLCKGKTSTRQLVFCFLWSLYCWFSLGFSNVNSLLENQKGVRMAVFNCCHHNTLGCLLCYPLSNNLYKPFAYRDIPWTKNATCRSIFGSDIFCGFAGVFAWFKPH